MLTNDTSQLSDIGEAWMSRFVENGVSLDDYRRTIPRIGSWSDWCAQWSSTAAEHEQEAAEAQLNGHLQTAAELRMLAAVTYHFAKFVFTEDMSQLRQAHRRAVDNYRAAAGQLRYPASPVEIKFEGTTLAGWLRLPAPLNHARSAVPVVVIVPGLDAAKEEMHRFEEVYLDRGMATLCFDGPGQGEAEYDLSIRPDWEVVATAAVNFIEKRPELDSAAVGVVGVSLGGYYAARAAAGEARVVAAASLGGCYDLGSCWQSLPPLTRKAFAVRSHSADDAQAGEAARQLTLDSAPGPIVRPLLVVHGSQDALFDEGHARRLIEKAGTLGTLIVEPRGDHVCHNLAYRVRPATADWMAAQLSPATN